MIYSNLAIWLLLFTLAAVQTVRNEMLKRQRKKERSIIAGLIHDLKNPINAQLNILDLLLKEQFGEINNQQKEMIKLTCRSCRYLSHLVYTILFSYKSESEKICINPEIFDLTSVICEVCKEYEYCAEDNNQAFVFNFPQEECCIYADKMQIKRVIYNFISNAVTYGLKNSYISIDAVKMKNMVEVTVNNKSKPVEKTELKNIFKKFPVCKNSQYNPLSIGLGLYTSKKIIELHNGSIFAKCSKDGIFSFGFRLEAKDYSPPLIQNLQLN